VIFFAFFPFTNASATVPPINSDETEAIASVVNETVSTNLYNENGELTSSKTFSFSSITSVSPEANVAAIVPVDPIVGGYPDRSIFDEPIDNTGLMYTFTSNGLPYYYIGAGTDSFAPGVLARIHRAYTSTYLDETHHWSWDAGMTIGTISAYIGAFGWPVAAIISILPFTVAGVLSYFNSLELATFEFNYTYQVTVDSVSYFTATRIKTYWRIDNITEGITKWELKSINSGFSMGNQELIRFGLEAYCAANCTVAKTGKNVP